MSNYVKKHNVWQERLKFTDRNVQIRQPERAAVFVLRAVAVVCILFCHLFEAYGISGSGWLYVGVPVFFALSGFLYGRHTILDWPEWALCRLAKLYVPYVLFVVPALLLFFVFKPDEMSFLTACAYLFNLQGLSGGVMGLNHLWFVTAIMACYILLPCLQCFRTCRNKSLLLSWALLILLFWFFKGRFYWLPLYMIAYFSAQSRLKTSLCVVLAVFCLQMCSPDMGESVRYSLIRTLIGLLIVFSTLLVFPHSINSRLFLFVKWLSGISYPLYLVHNILMVGPFALARLTPYVWLNTLLMLAGSFSLALLLKRAASFVVKRN